MYISFQGTKVILFSHIRKFIYAHTQVRSAFFVIMNYAKLFFTWLKT